MLKSCILAHIFSSVAAPSIIFKRLLSFRRSKSNSSVGHGAITSHANAVNASFDNNNVQIIKSISDLKEVLKQSHLDAGGEDLNNNLFLFASVTGASKSWFRSSLGKRAK
jgi:hypothetical protein